MGQHSGYPLRSYGLPRAVEADVEAMPVAVEISIESLIGLLMRQGRGWFVIGVNL